VNINVQVRHRKLISRFQAALDTLCSQSFASPNPKETSLHALRTAYLTFLIMIPAIIVILNGESLLLLLRQDPEVAHLAGRYLKGRPCILHSKIEADCLNQSSCSAFPAMLASRSLVVGYNVKA
jgi:MATE family multidrug resistance protein